MAHRILLVDDDDLLRSIYFQKFKDNGYEVYEAKDGLEGLNLALEKIPDFIFTGIMMPNLTGFEMIEKLKSQVKTADVPFAIFSHLGRKEDKVRSMELGSKGFFIKGMITPNEIVYTVTNILENKMSIKVIVQRDKLDGKVLADRLKSYDQEIVLELVESAEQRDVYTARLIK
jgi:DNA-binding response OmpR family regulator